MRTATDRGVTATWVVVFGLVGSSAIYPALAAPRPDPGTAIQIPLPPRPPRTIMTCTPPTGTGTVHNSVSMPETWTAAASPHNLPYDISISATLTIEACAVVRIGAGKTITINANGAFIAAGGNGFPVTIEPLVAGMAWSTIRNFGGILSLNHAIVRGGGNPLGVNPAYSGALRMQSNGQVGTLHVDDVEISGSMSQGVYINGDVGFDATSQNLRVNGSAGFPVHVYARVIGTVPTGNYTGNGRDAIAIAGAGGAVMTSQTMYNRGVPYHVGSGMDGGRMDVFSTSGVIAVLTIAPGVQIHFPAGGTLNVDPTQGTNVNAARGALVAIGTAAEPIVFTSDKGPASAAGDWLGIGFGGTVSSGSILRYAKVAFAGGPGTGSNSCPYPGRNGQNSAAIRIFGPAAFQFVTETEILNSALDGIDRGWRSDVQPDFLASNIFTAVAGCKQSTPRTAAGVCPVNPPCP